MPPRDRWDQDHYRLLECHPEATHDEIRHAYRRLALRWHPDRNREDAEAEERFKQISLAYAVLSDPARRRAYDAARQAGVPYTTPESREDLLRDLFSDPRAGALFDELARELRRLGLAVERHDFERTLLGGRAHVSGHVFIVGPFAPLPMLFRLARAALTGALASHPSARQAPRSLPGPRALLERAARWALGRAVGVADAPMAAEDVTLPLRLTRTEAEHGGRRPVTLSIDDRREDVLVTLPPGLVAGSRLRLRGKGRRGRDGRTGDVYLAVEVVG
jgi:curved DNA-binding protein CbpA